MAANYASAAARRAKANHTGAFVWGDSTDAAFASADANQFLIRGSGAVRIFSKSSHQRGIGLLRSKPETGSGRQH
jgi:hypothetical protein